MNIDNLKRKQALETSEFIIREYLDLLNDKEIEKISFVINNIHQLSLDEIEKILLPIVKKIWDNELNTGNYIIVSWNKYGKPKEKDIVTFATLCKKDEIIPFCNLTEGIEYAISFESIIGALWKDGATLIEDITKKNEYTIGVIDNKVINSYNGATKIITPKQLLLSNKNDYRSKHNELILDSKLINEIGEFSIHQKNL